MTRSFSVRELTAVAVGAALIAVCSWISVPTTIPFTMQTFAVCLIAALYGARCGFWTVLCYICLGLIGLPVFAGFRSGFAVLLGPTGGYITGFLFTAWITGAGAERFGRRMPELFLFMAAGLLVCYAFGTAWFMIVYAGKTGPIRLGTALAWCVLPYLLPDGVKITLAGVLTARLHPILPREVKRA